MMLRVYEYKRDGTLCLFGNLHVPTGGILALLVRQIRTEEGYLENIDNLIVNMTGTGVTLQRQPTLRDANVFRINSFGGRVAISQ